MKDRIKKIRKESTEKTLEKFGAKIGISAAALSQIENGKTEASKQTINTICDKFGINEVWLRTGEGDAYTKMPEDDLIKRTTELLGKHDPFFESLVYMYSELSDESRKIFLEKGAALFNDALRRQKEKE